MPLNDYYIYGLHIRSDLVCPELPLCAEPGGTPDVTIRTAPPVASVSESLENRYFEVRPGVFRLAVPGVAQYLVEEGSRIAIEPVETASLDEIRLFLLGSTMGALLYQRGLFPLHGSAVETPWGAMIFVGAQGIGKSTLVAQFHRHGYRLLSDDVCAVAAKPDGLEVLPAIAHFRLRSDAYERIGTPQHARFDVDKFVVPLGKGYCPHPVALRAIHVLVDREEGDAEFTILRGFDRVQYLLENLYRPQYLQGQSTQSSLMRMAGTIAQAATIAAVSRQRAPELIPALVGFLESAWAGHFGSAA